MKVLDAVKPLTVDQQVTVWAAVRNAHTFLRCVDPRDVATWIKETHCADCGRIDVTVWAEQDFVLCARCANMRGYGNAPDL